MTGLEAFKIVYNNFDYLISDVCIENDDVNICLKTIKEQLPTIKQALIKVEKEHKALEIIKEKNVDLRTLKACFKVECGLQEYNKHQYKENELTEKEFNILKEALK